MSEMASASFVIPASSAAAAVKTGSAVKSKKSKKRALRSTAKRCARASFCYGVRIEQESESAVTCTTCENKFHEKVDFACSSLAESEEVTLNDVIPRVQNVIKEKFVEERRNWCIKELMGKKWQGLVVAWSSVLYAVCENMPEYVATNESKEGGHIKPLLDEIVGCLMGQAIDMVRLTIFLEKKGMVCEVEGLEESGEGKDIDDVQHFGKLHGMFRGGMMSEDWIINKRFKTADGGYIEIEDEGLDFKGGNWTCDQLMHGQKNAEEEDGDKEAKTEQTEALGNAEEATRDLRMLGEGLKQGSRLRGGGRNHHHHHIGDGWIEIKKKGAKQERKSYYKNVKCNLAAVDVSMSPWECGSTENDDSSGKESEIGNEDLGLRGGGGGSATTTRKRQVTDAVEQMQEILKSLQTQPDGDDEVGTLVKDLKEIVKKWENHKPTKDEVKDNLAKIIEKIKGQAEMPKQETAERPKGEPKQSFYNAFHKKASEKVEERDKEKGQKSKAKGKGKTKTKDGKGSGVPKFDLRLAFPTKSITAWSLVMQSYEQGKEAEGCIAICPSCEKISEIQALAACHGLVKPITLVAKTDDSSANVQEGRKILLPFLGNLALVGATIATSTGAKPEWEGEKPIAAKALTTRVPKESLTTLRILVVKDLLEQKDLDKMKKTPAFAISLLGVDESITELRTSGWTDQLETIVGYVELPKVEEDKIKNKGGVFVSSLRKHVVSWPAVSWRHPEKNESMKKYFERIQKAATELGKPLAYRRGGGAAIGIVVDQEDEGQEHSWTASGVPHLWGPVTFREWLEAQGWTILDCRAPASKSQQWSFRGLLKGQKGRSYSYQLDGEEDAYIMIKRWEKRRKVEGEVVHIGGSSWWHKDATFDDPIEVDEEIDATLKWEAEIATTVPDTDTEMNGQDGKSKAEKSKMEDSTGNSPPKKKVKGGGKKKVEDVDRIEGGMPGPGKKTTIIDTGGCGDCGWRALSFSVAAHNASGGTTDEDLVDRLDVLSKTMQAKVTSYVINHKKQWSDAWCVDPNTSEQMEDGPVAQNIDEFCIAIRRRKRWVCGLVMAGAAMAQRINIVVWTKKEGEWVRIAILRCGSDWQKRPVIPLILSRGHYFALRMQKAAWPKEWAHDADDIPSSQDLKNDIQLRANFGRGGTDNFDTPKKGRKEMKSCREEDDVKNLLRTCSSKATEKTLNDLLRTCSTRRSGALRSAGKTKTSSKSVIKDRKGNKKSADSGNLLRTCSTVKSAKSGKDDRCQDEIKWKCPICEEVLSGKSKPVVTQMIAGHMVRLHYQKWREGIEANKWFHKRKSGFNLGAILRPVKFVQMEEKDKMEKAEYLCPYCPMVLPRVHHGQVGLKAQALIRRSKRLHLKECKGAKHNSMRQYWKDFVKAHADFHKRTSSARWYKSGIKHAANAANKAEQAGHEPVIFQFPWKCTREYGRFAIICKTCRRPFWRQNARNKDRKCKGSDGIPSILPGARFWQTVEEENLQELVCDKLSLSLEQAEESIREAEGWMPRTMRPSKKQC